MPAAVTLLSLASAPAEAPADDDAVKTIGEEEDDSEHIASEGRPGAGGSGESTPPARRRRHAATKASLPGGGPLVWALAAGGIGLGSFLLAWLRGKRRGGGRHHAASLQRQLYLQALDHQRPSVPQPSIEVVLDGMTFVVSDRWAHHHQSQQHLCRAGALILPFLPAGFWLPAGRALGERRSAAD